MRDKNKADISGQIKTDSFEKLKQLSESMKLSRIKVIEFLIDSYNAEPAKPIEKPPVKPMATAKAVVLPVTKEPVRKFNLAEELAKARQ